MNHSNPDNSRWPFIRDVLVFQLKLVLGNMLNFVLVPITIVTAIYDLVSGKPGARRGDAFYQALEAGREIEERINIYGAVGGYHATGASDDPDAVRRSKSIGGVDIGDATVDDVIRKVEGLIVRETGTGGRAAQVKSTLERLLDELRNRKG
ncbi:hypothetical protein [Nevskia sp.]|uniref:hypothetical protein n=1 Tax=Nevskia sp. TaxID=1929292 RepID=UPI0025ED9009|nr:hypothetical protein [Nevskia sp.]